ncbi:MAG: hypothetical protein KI786_05640, partial [Mameliella sp.]|nr:hypothetical protein [Phaeodactylibacter sp.]
VLGQPEDFLKEYGTNEMGCIRFQSEFDGIASAHQLVLSRKGDFPEAAQRLFAGMRQLDTLDLSIIVAELVPEEGLGRAINDRLRRAAAR